MAAEAVEKQKAVEAAKKKLAAKEAVKKKDADDATKLKAAQGATEKLRASKEKALQDEIDRNPAGEVNNNTERVSEANANEPAEENDEPNAQATEGPYVFEAQPAPATAPTHGANASPTPSGRVTRNRTTVQRTLSAVREEANATADDELVDLCPKPLLPKFGESDQVPAFHELGFITKKEVFTGPNPYLSERTTKVSCFWTTYQ